MKAGRAAYEVFQQLRHLLFATLIQGAKQETDEVQDLVPRSMGSLIEEKWKLHIIRKGSTTKMVWTDKVDALLYITLEYKGNKI